MPESFEYVVYDRKRERTVMEFPAFSDEKAILEFCGFYRELIGGHRWENRKLDRFYLFRMEGRDFEKSEVIFQDYQVRLDWERWFMADPFFDEASKAEDEREFERLDAIDVARIERRSNSRVDG